MRVALTPSEKKHLLATHRKSQLVKIQGTIGRVSSPIQYDYSTTPAPKDQETLQKRSGRARKSSIRMVSPRYDREVPLMQSQQDGWLNKTWAIQTQVDIPTQTGEISGGSLLDEELQEANNSWERENRSSPGMKIG